MELKGEGLKRVKPYVAVILLQCGNSGFALIAKAALNKGTNHFTFAVYRNAFAAALFIPFSLLLERKGRPRMTTGVFAKILMLAVLDPVLGQNMFYAGMNLTTVTFTAALSNLLPAITFVIAWILRVEKVDFKRIGSHAKIAGTAVAVAGAMVMTLVSGPTVGLPWTHSSHDGSAALPRHRSSSNPTAGDLMVVAGNFGYALFFILQAHTLKSYPAVLSLTALICTTGALLGTVLTFAVERGNTAIWALGWNATLLAYVYGGVVASGITYFIAGVIMKEKGPVFLTSFNPLSLVIVAILSSFVFAEQMTVGKITGAIVIVAGVYLFIWGKSKDAIVDDRDAAEPLPKGEDAEESQTVAVANAV
ncbi:WAT1-related protein At2g39510-like [Andrographis paniculata]|uniref:WAT1-related protein At2g39510-like n=1 Tax=Andrographis paniculata TaxID=175694 RepID=UPI0021E7FA64|nr:WAT1-related protein At2g39510-like [Andrographis paniculata]